MKQSIYFIIVLLFIACTKNSYDPDDIIEFGNGHKFVKSDITLFWDVFNNHQSGLSKETFQEFYINKGTKGLKDYAEQVDLATAFSNTLISTNYLNYYKQIEDNTKDIDGIIEKTIDGFDNLQHMYPQTRLFDVYFLIGSMTAGGKVSSNGLLIAVEMFCKSDDISISGLGSWHQSVICSRDYIPSIIIHELIHKQQHFMPKNSGYNTLLEQSIMEGMADFVMVASLPREPFINQHIHEFADTMEQVIWETFKLDLAKNYKETQWLYSGRRTSQGYPADLGYYFGYKILESYAQNFGNINDAIESMLTNPDYYEIYENSGYENKFDLANQNLIK